MNNKAWTMTAISTWLVLGALVLTTGCGRPKDGHDGMNGKDGEQGPVGNIGMAGHDGADGSSCSAIAVAPSSAAPNGGAMISCTDGTTSLVLNGSNGHDGADGQDGHDGINGTNGSNGSNGHDGAPGTLIAPIQFCSSDTTSYKKSVFPEYGFCINDELYAVYSTNGGFLAKIAPGMWNSNAVGSKCDFQVYDHCQVVQR